MKVIYNGPSPAVTAFGFYAERDVPVEVPAELGRSLCEGETFSEVKKSKVDPATTDNAQEG